jgi:hypothetical protein
VVWQRLLCSDASLSRCGGRILASAARQFDVEDIATGWQYVCKRIDEMHFWGVLRKGHDDNDSGRLSSVWIFLKTLWSGSWVCDFFGPLRPSDDYLAYKYNFIEIESDYDSDCNSGFDSAYNSCWCCMWSNRFAVEQKPSCHVIADVHVISNGVGVEQQCAAIL